MQDTPDDEVVEETYGSGLEKVWFGQLSESSLKGVEPPVPTQELRDLLSYWNEALRLRCGNLVWFSWEPGRPCTVNDGTRQIIATQNSTKATWT